MRSFKNHEEYMNYVKNCGHSQSMKRKFTTEEQQEVLKYWKEHKDMTTDEVASYFEKKFKMLVSCTGVTSVLVAKELGHIK